MRRWTTAGLLALGLVLAAPATASAAPDTPAGTGGGCAANGQAVATAAGGGAAFGQFVSGNAPIAPFVADFFETYC
ncbi:hypothetical protein [Geodermatophilus sp. FMUSA9-8]|uniref:hypothetical protein n=1 Tax=Geodermatophilus sp. FMUSA9-8 TaxID=3120155 RepID=UPI0030093CD0